MSAAQTSCPACGGPVRFKIGTAMVTVCEYCRSVVARGDRKLEDLGKVSAVTDTGAVLELGFKGRYDGVPFELVGRVQLGHAAGGVWDEWYAAFADGRWGWLAEAQGRYYLTFPLQTELPKLPTFDEIAVGGTIRLPPGKERYVVAEKGRAKALGAEGEMPYLFEPGAEPLYVDLSGEDARFGTLDYSEKTPLVFTGREATLAQLGVPKTNRVREREARQVEGIHLNCPQCGGPLDLKAPDQTERVGCPNCNALLDAKEGKLRLFQALDVPKVKPTIPLGARGKFPEGEFTVIGFMKRATTVESIDYFWKEYLLYEPLLGFRWLVEDSDHWNYVRPVSIGSVSVIGTKVRHEDNLFKLFQRGKARVTFVAGEFYWKVAIGEKTHTRDYIAPPLMLSREETAAGAEQAEINWSLGTYLPRQEVEQAFDLTGLPAPSTVGSNQPFRYTSIYKYWLYFLAAVVTLGLFFFALAGRHKVHEIAVRVPAATAATPTLPAPPGQVPAPPAAPEHPSKVFFSDHFELRPRRNIAVTMKADVGAGGVFVEGEFVHKETGDVQMFYAEMGYYQGVEDGESWTEDEREKTVYLSALPGGTYSLRLEVVPEKPGQEVRVRVVVEQSVMRLVTWLLTVLGLSLLPILVGLYHLFFEHRRWQESNCVATSE